MHFGESTGNREKKDRNTRAQRQATKQTHRERNEEDCDDPVTWHTEQLENRSVDDVGIFI